MSNFLLIHESGIALTTARDSVVQGAETFSNLCQLGGFPPKVLKPAPGDSFSSKSLIVSQSRAFSA
jgi:hypothetical protein